MPNYFVNLPNSSLSLVELCNVACCALVRTTKLSIELFDGLPSMWCTCSFGLSGLPSLRIMINRCSWIGPYSRSNTRLYFEYLSPSLFRLREIFMRCSSVIGDFFHLSKAALDIFSRCFLLLGLPPSSLAVSFWLLRSISNSINRLWTTPTDTRKSAAIEFIDMVAYLERNHTGSFSSAISNFFDIIASIITMHYVGNYTT